MCIGITIFVAQLRANHHCVVENPTKTSIETTQEFTCLITPQDLFVDQERIFVNLEGMLFPVHTLAMNQGQWVAKVDFGRDGGYCQRGHDLCKICGLCHKSGCWYYVEPCWKR